MKNTPIYEKRRNDVKMQICLQTKPKYGLKLVLQLRDKWRWIPVGEFRWTITEDVMWLLKDAERQVNKIARGD